MVENITLKDILDTRKDLQNLLFRRGYLFSNRSDFDLSEYPFYNNWEKRNINQTFVLYTHKEQHAFVVKEQGCIAILIGHAYNPFTMEHDETNILKDCIFQYCIGKDAFFEKVSELTGIHVIAIVSDKEFLFVQDCSGMKSCYYGTCGMNVYVTSHCALVEELDIVHKNSFVEKLVSSRSYSHGSKYLPGNLTFFKEMHRLGPNLYMRFDGMEFSIERFYPVCDHKEVKSDDEITAKAIAELIKKSVALCTKKWEKPAISLSGGVDSRTTLSAANGSYERFKYYSFYSKAQEKDDAQAAHQICSSLGFSHTIYPISCMNEDYEDFEIYKKIIAKNSCGISIPKDNEIRKYIFLSKLNDFDVELKSWASEIGRAFWERRYGILLPDALSPRHLSIFQTRYFGAPMLLKKSDKAYRDFMELSQFTHPMFNYENTDIFYWEYRFGSWGTIVTTGQDIFNFEVTMPLNNRKIMDMFLWYPHDFRKKDGVNKAVTIINEPRFKTIAFKVHNDYLGSKRLLLEKCYYYYRMLFYKNKKGR